MNTYRNIFYRKGCLPLLFIFCFSIYTYAQQEEKANRSGRAGSSVSVHLGELYEENTLDKEEAIWMREVYRKLDLIQKKENTPLYYPAETTSKNANFFANVFRLVYTNKVPAYEYRDGQEIFDDSSKIKVKDLLEKFSILYTEEGSGRLTTYKVEDSDIPSSEVKTIYIKERYYFDQRSSQFNVMVEAICPVLHRGDEWGEEELKYPLFWVKMSDLIPYLSNSFIMLSDLNNATHTNLNDYFALRLYKGEIYKTSNLLNRNLIQYCPDETALSEEQNRIEKELKTFEENLWASDSTHQYTSSNDKKGKSKKCTSPTTSKFSSSKSKSSGGGDASSSSGAVYSVRRER